MNSNYVGILLGGLLPAVVFGISGVCLKACRQQGISLNYCLLFAGAGAVLVGLLLLVLLQEKSVSATSGTNALLVGLMWGTGTALMAMALIKYNAPISVLAPLTSTACLVTTLLALWVFSEWKEAHVVRLLIGAFLIVVGAMLVSTSVATGKIQQASPPDHPLSTERAVDSG